MREKTLKAVEWQKSLDDIDDELFDVLVVGAGPAGSTAAIHLASAGYSVLLVDMASFPRVKVCGDCMITDVPACLKRVGLLEAVHRAGTRLDSISMFSTSGVEFAVPGAFFTLRREILDTILAERAASSGAVFAAGQADRVLINDDQSLTALFRKSELRVRARYGIIATGAHVGLARRLEAVDLVKPSAIAARCYVRSKMKLDRIILSYDKSLVPGYGWIVPLGDGVYNVGCGFFFGRSRSGDLRRCFESFESRFPLAEGLISEGEVIAPLRAAPLRCGLRGVKPRVGRTVLIAGETVGTTFPLTGEGIGQAMRTGELAASAIDRALRNGDRDHLDEYPKAIEAQLRSRHSGFEYAQKWVSRPWLNDFMARRVKRSGYLREACSRFIADSGDPRIVYSLAALVKSFWK